VTYPNDDTRETLTAMGHALALVRRLHNANGDPLLTKAEKSADATHQLLLQFAFQPAQPAKEN
jgi:hypothetical protein